MLELRGCPTGKIVNCYLIITITKKAIKVSVITFTFEVLLENWI